MSFGERADAVKQTSASLTIDSDWASIVLISSNASIQSDSNFTYPTDSYITGTQLFVGTQGSKSYQNKTISFYIVGDGSDVDIALAHGDDSSSGSNAGNVSVTYNGNTYKNSTITGDGVNSKVFAQTKVVG